MGSTQIAMPRGGAPCGMKKGAWQEADIVEIMDLVDAKAEGASSAF